MSETESPFSSQVIDSHISFIKSLECQIDLLEYFSFTIQRYKYKHYLMFSNIKQFVVEMSQQITAEIEKKMNRKSSLPTFYYITDQ